MNSEQYLIELCKDLRKRVDELNDERQTLLYKLAELNKIVEIISCHAELRNSYFCAFVDGKSEIKTLCEFFGIPMSGKKDKE